MSLFYSVALLGMVNGLLCEDHSLLGIISRVTKAKPPKAWHVYIVEFLYVNISKYGKQNLENYLQVLLEKTYNSLKFIFFSKRQLKPFPKKIMVTQRTRVHKVSGRLRASFHQFISCKNKLNAHPSASKWRFCLEWRFKLDSQIALNFTFDHVFFSQYVSSRSCLFGALELHNGRPTPNHLKFCGELSKFSVFSKSIKQVLLRLHVHSGFHSKHNFEFDLGGSFTIFDARMMNTENSPPELRIIPWLLQTDLVKLSRKFFVMHFLIRKLGHQIIEINPDKSLVNRLIVHDGPISSLSIIKPTNGVYETSTFQCMVMLIGEHNNFKIAKCPKIKSRWSKCKHKWNDKTFAQKINVKAKPIENVQEIAIDGREKQMLQLSCPGNPNTQVVFVTTNTTDIQANVTVQTLIYSGPSSSLCLFGGFAVTEPNTENSVVYPLLCKSENPSEGHQGKSFYSSKSSLHLLLFGYNTLSSVIATVTITSTRCKLVQICDCSYHYCTRSALPPVQPCEQYLKERSVAGNVLIEFGKKAVVLSITIDKCIILQIVRNFTQFFVPYSNRIMSDCPTEIHLKRHFKRKFLMAVRGSVNFLDTEEEYLLKCAPNRRKFRIVDSANVLFCGLFEKFCYPIDTNQSYCETLQVENTTKIINLSNITNRFSDNSFFVAASTTSFLGSMFFTILRHVFTNSWMEFIISNIDDHSVQNGTFTQVECLSSNMYFKVFDFPGTIVGFKLPHNSQHTSSQIFASSDCLSRESNPISRVSFVSHWQVKKQLKQIHISLPGRLIKLTILSTQNFSNTEVGKENVTISWLFKMYEHSQEISTAKTKSCLVNTSFNSQLKCRSFSHLMLGGKNQSQFYFALEFCLTTVNSKVSDKKHISWVEAEKLCQAHSGYLPKFVNIGQLQELLGILKFTQDVRPVEGTFLGLKYCPFEVCIGAIFLLMCFLTKSCTFCCFKRQLLLFCSGLVDGDK